MSLASGKTLASYEILGPLGAGAMGEVYRARDTRLDRDVAIKVLPQEFAQDRERLLRFEREAKSIASLNHANVAHIYGVDQVDTTYFLVLELVEGETLEDRLKRGPLPVDEALDVCRQIAEGLEAAHEAGVIHRDLKPANIRITPEGLVKLLDFGLAKSTRPGADIKSSTDSVLSTEQGRLLGTPTYMAPEQARGKSIDRRVDIWAFGCVLFECLTAQRAFGGDSLSDVLAAVIEREVDLTKLPPATPPRVRELVERCLAKDSRQRMRDMGDARWILQHARDDHAAGATAAASPSIWRRGMPWSVVALIGGVFALIIGSTLYTDMDAPPRRSSGVVARLAVRTPSGWKLRVDNNTEEDQVLAISPDGSQLVFVAESGQHRQLFRRALDSFECQPIPGTDDATSPFFSPDGAWVAFIANAKLRKVALGGGNPIDLCESGLGRGGAWGPDGTIVFSPTTATGLVRISSNGGAPAELTHLEADQRERSHRWPCFLPGGKEVAFTVGTEDKPGDYEDAQIDVVSLETGRRRHLLRGASQVRVTANGALLLGRDGEVFALPLGSTNGGAVDGATHVLSGVGGVPSSGIVYFDIARNGTLAYVERDPHAAEFELCWVSSDGRIEPLQLPPREYRVPRVSPDGKKLAVAIGPGRGRPSDIWICDLVSGSMTRLSVDSKNSSYPAWTADGKRVAYGMTPLDGATTGIASKAADGSDAYTLLARFDHQTPRAPLSWSPDSKTLLFQQDGGAGKSSDILYLALADSSVHPFAATGVTEFSGALSPDGAWFAYCSDDSGASEVYVQSFPGAGGRWQISDGGAYPRWSADGREITYISGEDMIAVSVTTSPTFSHGQPHKLFTLAFQATSDAIANYDRAPDGRFLVVRGTTRASTAEHVNVVLDWFADLQRAMAKK
jgi:serine/threonine-protein kinase